MAIIDINYKGCNFEYDEKGGRVEVTDPKFRLKYKSVHIHCQNNGYNRTFKSGSFVKDWYDMKKYYLDVLQDIEPNLSGSSTCDHFISDGAEYDPAYLHVVDDKPVLKYPDYSDPHWYMGEDVDGWEFYVEKGTKPTWGELRELCGDKKQTS